MTIAEEQIKRLAQEAHGFAREAHSVVSVLESKLEQFEQTHLPQIQAALASVTDAKSVIDNSSGLVKTLAEGLNAITAEVKALRDDFINANLIAIDTQTVSAEETSSQVAQEATAETVMDTATTA